ncbi:hypothetical protein H9P43_001372 [Blastocladiella emersonii ATCC 22665]|nr:hypothetical protein H9P43_001372 [Blastocladiella emersonii ATCC 22665]
MDAHAGDATPRASASRHRPFDAAAFASQQAPPTMRSFFAERAAPGPAADGGLPSAPSSPTHVEDLPPLTSYQPTRAIPLSRGAPVPGTTFKAPRLPASAMRARAAAAMPATPALPAISPAPAQSSPSKGASGKSPAGSVGIDDSVSKLANPGLIRAKWQQVKLNAKVVAGVALVWVAYRLIFGRFLPYSATWAVTLLAKSFGWIFATFALLNAIEGLFMQYIKPFKWASVRETVSQLNPRQRKLLAVDENVSRLVDAVSARKPSSTLPPVDRVPATPALAKAEPATTRRTNDVRIQLRNNTLAAPTPSCIPTTSDVRYTSQNALLRAERDGNAAAAEVEEMAAAAAAAAAGGASVTRPINIPLKPVFQTYQLSSVPTADEQQVADADKPKLVNALETLAQWSVDENQLNVWIENLREWLALKVFQPLVADIRKVEAHLDEKGWQHLSIRNVVPAVDPAPVAPVAAAPTSSLFGAKPATTFTGFGTGTFGSTGFGSTAFGAPKPAVPAGPPTSLNGLAQLSASDPLARLRVQLERYLFLTQYPVTIRSYVLRRIGELASGSGLAAYRWDAGGHHEDGKPWTNALPTDAELVMHIFATWIDLQMPGAGAGVATFAPFSTKYVFAAEADAAAGAAVAGGAAAPQPTEQRWALLLAKKSPPHFRVSQGKVVYDVFPKRSNLFATLALFTFLVRRDYASYIDMLDIGGNVIGLTDILTDDE